MVPSQGVTTLVHSLFSLTVKTSTVPCAGKGVFIHPESSRDCTIPSGTVVAHYAGVFYPSVPWSIRSWNERIVDTPYLLTLHGGGIIDPRYKHVSFETISEYWLVLENFRGILDGYDASARVGKGAMSPYAVGQYVNHPPQGVAPNVAWHDFTVQTEPESWTSPDAHTIEMLHEGPATSMHSGLWFICPDTMEAINVPPALPLPGVRIIALRDLEAGEELFMDYKLSLPHPAWYHPVRC